MIIAVLATIISPVIIKLLNENRQKMYNNQIRTLEEAAKRWSVANYDKLKENETYCLSLNSLCFASFNLSIDSSSFM